VQRNSNGSGQAATFEFSPELPCGIYDGSAPPGPVLERLAGARRAVSMTFMPRSGLTPWAWIPRPRMTEFYEGQTQRQERQHQPGLTLVG